ncbi:TetR/AcrR family transcriptional regulator [Crossiella sp. CA198]|uniref:TetR/AcrR family transcriptional regulator n=1 Tax=Crossiella sp. CA198 TaxID=3455607 RepID=UPI003F8CF84E
MPLPRYYRLPTERRRHLLDIARAHFATDGLDGASYNKIITAAGISKTSAYQYFDGREDLLAAVVADARDRLADTLGTWPGVLTRADFWRELRAGATRLLAHVIATPADLAVAVAMITVEADQRLAAWLDALLADGRKLGLVRAEVDPELMRAATAAVFRAADGWLATRLAPADPQVPEQLWRLLAGLWSAPELAEADRVGAGGVEAGRAGAGRARAGGAGTGRAAADRSGADRAAADRAAADQCGQG